MKFIQRKFAAALLVAIAGLVLQASALAADARVLPERLDLRYSVRYGDEGIKLGQAVYTWEAHAGRYHLTSVARATGLAALLVKGGIEQDSQGAVTATGLRPEHYSITRGKHRQETANFQGAAASGEVQDMLSFPFHLAMTADEGAKQWTLWVTKGDEPRDYQFRKLGMERVEVGMHKVDALHLQGRRSDDSGLDVWLAPSRQWLPARIRSLDDKGKVVLMTLEE